MKKVTTITVSLLFITSLMSCVTLVDVKKERPAVFKTKKVRTVYVGYLSLPENLWKTFGYKSKGRWLREVRGNNAGIKTYLRENMPGKIIRGAGKKPGSGDIYITFKYMGYVQKYPHFPDEIKVNINFISIKTGRTIYNSIVVVQGTAAFPRNWKASTIEGRLDNMMYNIAGFISKKLE